MKVVQFIFHIPTNISVAYQNSFCNKSVKIKFVLFSFTSQLYYL